MRQPERRSARRVRAKHAARLQFVIAISGAADDSGGELHPSLICRTRDASETGLGLEVPALREDDRWFFGVEAPVKITIGLPSGTVEARGVTVRYKQSEARGELGAFLVGVRITGMYGSDAERFRAYVRGAL